MRIGPFIGTMGAAGTLQGQVRQVVNAESDGFDSFWTPQIAGVDALTMLALSGQDTQAIEVGTAVVPTYPRHPTALAQQALTTQAATGEADCCSVSVYRTRSPWKAAGECHFGHRLGTWRST